MRRYLLDTGIASAFVNRDADVRDRVRELTVRGDRVGIGMPVLGELWAGVELSAQREKNTALLKNALGTLFLWPFDTAAAQQYGRVFAKLKRIGRPMQQIDIQIAAIAFALGKTTVVSSDTDLSAVPGLDVENWLYEMEWQDTPMGNTQPHPLNAPGDFYVEYGCCTACDIPKSIAPDLFSYDDTQHCYICRQPSVPAETAQMLDVIRYGELQCIRYRGSDPRVFDRLAALGETDICDNPPAGGLRPAIRSYVGFDVKRSSTTLYDVVESFKQFLETRTSDETVYVVTKARIRRNLAYVQFEIRIHSVNHTGNYRPVFFQTLDAIDGKGAFCAYHDEERTVLSELLHRWIEDSDCFHSPLWFTRSEWQSEHCVGRLTPW